MGDIVSRAPIHGVQCAPWSPATYYLFFSFFSNNAPSHTVTLILSLLLLPRSSMESCRTTSCKAASSCPALKECFGFVEELLAVHEVTRSKNNFSDELVYICRTFSANGYRIQGVHTNCAPVDKITKYQQKQISTDLQANSPVASHNNCHTRSALSLMKWRIKTTKKKQSNHPCKLTGFAERLTEGTGVVSAATERRCIFVRDKPEHIQVQKCALHSCQHRNSYAIQQINQRKLQKYVDFIPFGVVCELFEELTI